MTAPRPSDDLLDWAYKWCGPRVGGGPNWTEHADDLAQQVAAKIAEVHARYERVAKAQRESCEQWWQEANGAQKPDLSYARGRQHAADQAAYAIRKVAEQ